jgi:secernin
VDGHTLLAHNSHRPSGEGQFIVRAPGQAYPPGEIVQTQHLRLPQARQTYTVLGHQPAGQWGFTHGVNDQGVAIGYAVLNSKLTSQGPGLSGTDLVRLALERSSTALHAVDLLTELIERHGQGRLPDSSPQFEGDNAFLVADPHEAYLIEAAGHFWVEQQILEVRALSDVSVVHQDWNRISRGLSGQAIDQGWWPADGSKLDFATALAEDPIGPASALRRWGRATLLLEEQNGHIDTAFLRRLLGDHYEGMYSEVDPLRGDTGPIALCQHGLRPQGQNTVSSMVAQLHADSNVLRPVWCAFGPPCGTVFFPIFLEGELPRPFTQGNSETDAESVWWRMRRLNDQFQRDPQRTTQARASFNLLQARFDQEADEFAAEGAVLREKSSPPELQRLAGNFMQHHLEQFESVVDSLMQSATWDAEVGGSLLAFR